MLAYICFICITTLISKVLTEQNPFSELKFQQTDYKVEFERAEVVRYNKDVMKLSEARTFKYNRTCTAVNTTFEYNIDIGNDLEIISQAYAFLSNEYRLFPLRFEVNFCEAMAKNYVGYGGVGKCGNFSECPIRKGRRYHYCNFTPDEKQFPPFIPDGRYMMELQGMYKNDEAFLVRGYGRVYRPIAVLGK